MNIWEKLSRVNIVNKELYQRVFVETFKKIQKNSFSLEIGETRKKDYTIIVESDRMNSLFVHIVPNQLYDLFREMQRTAPNEVLGFSVLAGKKEGKEVRVSGFGIRCDLLGKALFEKKNN